MNRPEKKKKKFSLFKLIIIVFVIVLLLDLILTLIGRSAPSVEPSVVNNDTSEAEKTSYDGFTSQLNTTYSSNWKLSSNIGVLDTSVVNGVRAKRTLIRGNGNDTVTIMVYMCGSDLESQSAMGVYDLVEMSKADVSNLNIIVYTGGSKKWHTDAISARVNQIYQVVGNGQIQCLVENAGTGAMTDPNTLNSFIEYCTDNYEANRYELIFWDHGGGTVSGYGYDEKYPNSGSMSLAGIDKALTAADVEFDFIGFDACLMATTETAMMLAEHADYLIASEESEPGIGWYYTNWLSKFNANTSMSTIDIGKNIADDFVKQCGSECRGQTATLSVIDLAEIQDVLPAKLSAFANSTNQIIADDYRTVASARSGAREFAADTRIDMVDLVGMAANLNTPEAQDLCQTLMSAIKYNNANIANAYGLSIYFPYRSTKYLSTVLNVYDSIDMNQDYSDCIRSFASYAGAGQISSGGSHYAYQSYDSYDNYYSSGSSSSIIFDLLDLFLSGGYSDNSSYYSYYKSGVNEWFDRSNMQAIADYIAENHFDGDLNWKDDKIALSEKQWEMIDELRLNVFIDDGEGYIDLGRDALFEINEDLELLKPEEMTWMVASADEENWQFVPFYYLYRTESAGDYVYTGIIPCLLNETQAYLIVEIADDLRVIGASFDYEEGNEIVAKNLYAFNEGDEIEFICDYYDYDGNYTDSYVLGDKLIVKDQVYLGDKPLSDSKYLASYEFTDIYQQTYWSQAFN